MSEAERCWRCSAEMEWRHGTWQCPRCRFKLGCCEGEPQSSCEAAMPDRAGSLHGGPGARTAPFTRS